MFVHKRTLGALPSDRDPGDLDALAWWVVPDGTALARKIELCYPFFDPVAVAGELVDAIPWPAWRRYGEEPPPPPPPPPRRRRYNRKKQPPR